MHYTDDFGSNHNGVALLVESRRATWTYP